MNNFNRVAIAGADGRMGKNLILAIMKEKKLKLGAALVRSDSVFLEKDICLLMNNSNKLGICLNDQIKNIVDKFDVLIDFTSTDNTIKNVLFCKKNKKFIVIGTTGFNKKEKNKIIEASLDIGIVLSPNFSIGINLVKKLVEKTTKTIGNKTDIDIIDIHHRNKLDSPSGTAIDIGDLIAQIMKIDLEKNSIYLTKGINKERSSKKIGFSMIRTGNVFGEHSIMFTNENEQIEIKHRAFNRMPFAYGALRAAKWLLKNKKNGLYNMKNVLD